MLIHNKIDYYPLHIDIINDYFRNIKFGYITYVCVKKEYQNRRIGTYLLEKADTIAKDNNLSYYELTSISGIALPFSHLLTA